MSIISDLASGATGGLLGGIGTLAKNIRSAVGKTDPDVQANIELQLKQLQATAEDAQAKIDQAEASNPSVFVAGWRPALGWVCCIGLAYSFILLPFGNTILGLAGSTVKLPMLDSGMLMTLITGMLGLVAARTTEKLKSVDRDNMDTSQ